MKMNVISLFFLCLMFFTLKTNQQKAIELNSKNFDDLVLNSKQQWLISFSAGDWCPPCTRLRPVMEELAKAVEGQISVKIGKLDAQIESQLGEKYQIRGYPTLFYFSGGNKQPAIYQGDQSFKTILQFIYNKNMMIAMKQIQTSDLRMDGSVYVLNAGNFESFFESTKEWIFLKVYTNWCPPCNRMEPEWQKLATYLKSINANVKIAKVDLASEPDCEEFVTVSSYPALLLFPPGKKHFSMFEQYTRDDDRTKEALLEFLMSKINNSNSIIPLPDVLKLSEEVFDSLVMKSKDPFFIKFGTPNCPPCQKMEPDWTNLAKKLKANNKNIKIASIDASIYPNLAQRFRVNGYPSLLFFPEGQKEQFFVETYESYDRSTDSLYSFIEARESILILNDTTFNQKLNEYPESIFFVDFTLKSGCGICQEFNSELTMAAKELRHDAKFVKVFSEDSPSIIKKFQISGYPTIKLFHPHNNQTNKRKIDSYTGQRHHVAISQWLLEKISLYEDAAPDTEVIEISDETFDSIIMESEKIAFVTFHTSWCSHCQTLKPQINKLARKIKGKAIIGRVDVEKNQLLKNRFGVNAFPTIKIFPAGNKLNADIQDYNGGKGVNTMYQFLMEQKKLHVSLKFYQLINQKQFAKYCKNNFTCVISFLPNIQDATAANRSNYLQKLQNIAEATENLKINFLWAQGGDFLELEQFLQMEGLYPTIVSINADKNQINIMRGAFEQNKIFKYIRNIMVGKEKGKKLNGQIPEIKQVEKWDGQDFTQQ